MSDQAQQLRQLIYNNAAAANRSTRVITVTSGKGGVGKSNFTLNFALQLKAKGFRVLVFDADNGFANIDVLMGLQTKLNLFHLLKRQNTIDEIIHTGYQGLDFIAGGSGFNELAFWSEEDAQYFFDQVMQLNGKYDFILFDLGAGLSKESLKFIIAANETILVTTPEPTSITDAYAIIKMVQSMKQDVRFHLVVNRADDDFEGKYTADKITLVAKQFLKLDIPIMGTVPEDGNVQKAVKKQVPFSVAYPNSPATRQMARMAEQYIRLTMAAPEQQEAQVGMRRFLNRMMRMLQNPS
jgi:flagellar biosynthesis protein FlhG